MADDERDNERFYVQTEPSSRSQEEFRVGSSQSDVQIELEYLPTVNFAVQQNSESIFKTLTIANNSNRRLENLRVEIKTEPNFLTRQVILIDRIDPGLRYRQDKFVDSFNFKLLSELTERVKGGIKIEVAERSRESRSYAPIVFAQYPVALLPCNQWVGLNEEPALLAAYVTPNLSEIAYLSSAASDALRRMDQNGALTGYSSYDREKIYAFVQAVYEAVAEQGIEFANCAPSFEETGQRIRTVEKILDEKLANCLDLSLLFASVFENIGLNSLIILLRGHAFVGVHLIDDQFPNSFIDDLPSLRKNVDAERIAVFESTSATQSLSFSQAVRIAKNKLNEADDIFEGALDVAAARDEGVRPLPLVKKNEFGPLIPDSDQVLELDLVEERKLPGKTEPQDAQTRRTRLDRWKQSLLDLSARNKLISMNEKGNKAIPILFPGERLAELEDMLLTGTAFKLLPITPDEDKAKATERMSEREAEQRYRREIENALNYQNALYIRPGVCQKDMDRRLTAIGREARHFIQESGCNVLYLALGVVERNDSKSKNKRLRAPLLLVPVELDGSAKKGFVISRRDDDELINVTLLEQMRRDHAKIIRGLDPNALPTDAHGLDVDRIFQIFQQEIADFPNWELKREVVLALFSFQKFVMWSDLNDNVEALKNSPIVRHLIDTPTLPYRDSAPEVQAEEIDNNFPYVNLVTPLSSDSSQMAAILTAAGGKSFALQGPPGTGKSQTIANIISHCLYNGKKILFVAEKRAALEVVYNRLRQLGLGPFCLELHSNKSGKQQVLAQLNEAITLAEQQKPDEWQATTAELDRLRNVLNQYARELHRKYPNGLSLYDALSWLEPRSRQLANVPLFTGNEDVCKISQERLRSLIQLAEDVQKKAKAIPQDSWNDLLNFGDIHWSPKSSSEIEQNAKRIRELTAGAIESVKYLAKAFNKTPDGSYQEALDLVELEKVVAAPDFDAPQGLYSGSWLTDRAHIKLYLDAVRARTEYETQITALGAALMLNAQGDDFESKMAAIRGLLLFKWPDANNADNLPSSSNAASTQCIEWSEKTNRLITATLNALGQLGLTASNVRWARLTAFSAAFNALLEEPAPNEGLLGAWEEFSVIARELASATRRLAEINKILGNVKIADYMPLNLTNVGALDAIERLPDGAFQLPRPTAAPGETATPIETLLNTFSTNARDVADSASELFKTLGLQDEFNEENVSRYYPLLNELATPPLKNARLIDYDWIETSGKLKSAVAKAQEQEKEDAELANYDVDLVLNFNAQEAANSASEIPSGAFAFEYALNSRKKFSLSLSLNNTGNVVDPLDLSPCAAAIKELKLTSTDVADYLGFKEDANENNVAKVRELVLALREYQANNGKKLGENWTDFHAEANAFATMVQENLAARKKLVDFDLDKVLNFDVKQAQAEYKAIQKTFFLFRGKKRKAFEAKTRSLTLGANSNLCKFSSGRELLDQIQRFVESQRYLDEHKGFGADRISAYPIDGTFDNPATVGCVESALKAGDRLDAILDETSTRVGLDKRSLTERVDRFLAALADRTSNERQATSRFDDAWDQFLTRSQSFFTRLDAFQKKRKERKSILQKYDALCSKRFGDAWIVQNRFWPDLTEYIALGDRIADKLSAALPNRSQVREQLQAVAELWPKLHENEKIEKTLDDFLRSWVKCARQVPELATEFAPLRSEYVQIVSTIETDEPYYCEKTSKSGVDPDQIDRLLKIGELLRETARVQFPTRPDVQDRFLKNVDRIWARTGQPSDEKKVVDDFLAAYKEYDHALANFAQAVEQVEFPRRIAGCVAVSSIEASELPNAFAYYFAAVERARQAKETAAPFAKLATNEDDMVDAQRARQILGFLDELETRLRSFPAFEKLNPDAKELCDVRDAVGKFLAREQGSDELNALIQRANQLMDQTKDLHALSVRERILTVYRGPLLFVQLDEYATFAETTLRALPYFSQWEDWRTLRPKAIKELPEFVQAVETRTVDLDALAEGAQYRLYEEFADSVVERESCIRETVGNARLRDNIIEDFRRCDEKYAELARRLVSAQLSSQLPTRNFFYDADSKGPLGLLKREITLKKHVKSLREILARSRSAIRDLKPCFLMSPLSVAQYIPADDAPFDLVIFDEASQIPTCDAIGAIARGRQLIVVGDSKQMPPTTFFQSAATNDEEFYDDENDEEIDDALRPLRVFEVESVLEECVAAQIPNVALKWHYRSRNEALIAFSNNKYYDGKLNTFPAATRESGVKFVYVEDGLYRRGESLKTNEPEAKRIVEDVVKRLSEPGFDGSSLGIVTFNEAQRDLIDTMLEKAVNDHPEIEKYFSPDYYEPVFVKNLENVQGDERDFIYFSICYGKDKNGKISNNFGPLNKVGGERRLNVAVTRAKRENIVYSSMRGSDLQLSTCSTATGARGVKDFKEFLLYAENGGRNYQQSGTSTQDAFGAEEEIAKFLREKGYQVDTQVGRSKYRVDVAILAPGSDEEYAVGVMCDGASYRDSATARDRDILRKNVLEGLGWQTARVWTPAWRYNRKQAEEKLLSDVQKGLDAWERAKNKRK